MKNLVCFYQADDGAECVLTCNLFTNLGRVQHRSQGPLFRNEVGRVQHRSQGPLFRNEVGRVMKLLATG